ncbi:GspH/FimT family pseudopilin [Oceanobacter antarcticus]|jgi:prepilin-type N-terminal cleavage/methylation domain-containing protein|uniref:Type II secretion system protein H n=1 Tax=Oceanobacter antarcticus TaxID=3133425 RepID=A0ABW8NEK5_9GAMM
MTRFAHGTTLTELMVVIAILAIAAFTIAPATTSIIQKQLADRDVSLVHMAIATARSRAILTQTPHTLCPLDSSKHCSRNWNNELTLFADRNRNRTLDDDDTVVQRITDADNTVLRSYNRSAISFGANGFAGGYNGSFSYCRTTSMGQHKSAAFILSRIGRLRPGTDSDNNGRVELANGQDVECP